MFEEDRRSAWGAARSAVGVYAGDPSDKNAQRVELALGTVKDLKQALWRAHLEEGLQAN